MEKKIGMGEGGCSHFTETEPRCFNKITVESAVCAGSEPRAAVQRRVATTPTSAL